MLFKILKGKTIVRIDGCEVGSEKITFYEKSGRRFVLHHNQSCCETVTLNEIIGDYADLIGSPILLAEEASNVGAPSPRDSDCSYTWTFYKLSTIKGGVTLRWLGESNGYYSEDVDFKEIDEVERN